MYIISDKLAFSRPSVREVGIDSKRNVTIRPISGYPKFDPSTPVEFAFNNPTSEVDLDELCGYAKLSIVDKDGQPAPLTTKDKDGTDVPSSDNTTFVNMPFHSMIKRLAVVINDKEITLGVGDYYNFYAYTKVLTQYNEDVKESYLRSIFYKKDDRGQKSFDTASGTGNSGYVYRNKATRKGGIFDIYGPFFLDSFRKYIPSGCNFILRIYFNEPSQFLMSDMPDKKYTAKLHDIFLKVPFVNLEDECLIEQTKLVQDHGLNFNINKDSTEIRAIPYSRGTDKIVVDNLFLNRIPSKVMIYFVRSDSLGNYSKNPYYFYHNNATKVSLLLNGEHVFNSPLNTTYEEGNLTGAESFHALYSSLNSCVKNRACDITREEWLEGYSIWSFKVSPKTNDCVRGPIKQGTLTLDMHLDKALQENVYLMVQGTFDTEVIIDAARNVQIL